MSEITEAATGVQPELEALLLLATEPLPVVVLAETVRQPESVVATRPEQADLISRWVVEGLQNRLSQASMETLAVIAYSQPVARSRVSAVRGVNVDGVVRTLIARGLIAEQDRDESTGAGLLCTTDYFLERLGLASLDDLPPIAPHLPEAADLAAELSALAIIPDNVEKTDDRRPN